MNETKQEFLDRMSAKYDKILQGQQYAQEIEKQIAYIRNQGYNLIVMGTKVKVTLSK